METYPCPKGHSSTESDFCSECGAKIEGVPRGTAPPAASPPAARIGVCPACGAPRTAEGGNFCEICGWNFVTGTAGGIPSEMPVELPTPAPSPVTPSALPLPVWVVTVSVDPSLRAADSPEVPADFTPLEISVEKPLSLIGRRSEARAVFPEISLDFDTAVSHRHALLNLGPDGVLTLRDIGSANGTELNGTGLQPMTDTPVKDGDQISLGHFTRLALKTRA